MFGLGPWELAVILVIVIIIFGVGKLPEIGTGLGEGIKNFKKSFRDANALDVTGDSNNSTNKARVDSKEVDSKDETNGSSSSQKEQDKIKVSK